MPVAAGGVVVMMEMLLLQAEALDLRAHGPVEDEDAAAGGGGQRGDDFGAVGDMGLGGHPATYYSRKLPLP